MTDREIYKKIVIELRYFRFSRNSIAFQYLIDAIYLVVREKKYIKNFNYYVYPKIAKRYGTKTDNVLWCISKLINLMYENTDNKVITKYFNTYYKNKPSPKEFIITVADNVHKNSRTEYKKANM